MKNLIIFVSICLIYSQAFCLAQDDIDRPYEQTADSWIIEKQNKNREDRNQWRELLKWPDEFEKKTQGYGPDFSGIEFYDITARQYIVHVYGSLGSYQGEHLFYVIEKTENRVKATPMVFEQFSEIEKQGDDSYFDPNEEKEENADFKYFTDSLVYGTISFDPEKKHLINLNRYRGSGGCGTQTIYDVTGKTPKTIAFRARVNCNIKNIPPELWKPYSLKALTGCEKKDQQKK